MLAPEKNFTVEELLARAAKPSEDGLRLHPFYQGKVEVTLKCAVRNYDDFAIWYSPRVAAPCREIYKDPDLVYEYTNNWKRGVECGLHTLDLWLGG